MGETEWRSDDNGKLARKTATNATFNPKYPFR